jgi:hypothetical protein
MNKHVRKSPETPKDVVYTPDWCAKDMVEWFQPRGRVLEPCRGGGGIDFFQWDEKVDWCISNPPYSLLRKWFRHTFTLAKNAVYLVPLRSVFSGYGMLEEIREYGGIAHIRVYGTGNFCGFPMGNAIGAVHFKEAHDGPIGVSFYQYGQKRAGT